MIRRATIRACIVLFALAGPARAGVAFYTDEATWTAAIGAASRRALDTTPSNVALADEVPAPPGDDAQLGAQLAFRASSTGLCGGFVLWALEAGAGLTYDDQELGAPVFPAGTLSIGDAGDFENDDFQLAFPTASFFAAGFYLVGNSQHPDERFSVFGARGLLGSLGGSSIPDGEPGESTFLGVIASEPISSVCFDEQMDADGIAIRDFRFACAAGDPDADGLGDLAERRAGTGSADPDSDDDGLPDGDEVGTGTFGPRQVISDLYDPTMGFASVADVFAADLDGDGDQDVLAAAAFVPTMNGAVNAIGWYENTDGKGHFGPRRVISTLLIQPNHVFAADLDGDGDADVLSSSTGDKKIAWYENTDGQGNFGPQRVIATLAFPRTPASIFAADLDGDHDPDVIFASTSNDAISWYENLDGAGSFGPERVVSTATDGPFQVFAADMDGDGDVDVLSAAQYDTVRYAWYENADGLGGFGARHPIPSPPSSPSPSAFALVAADVDGDGDNDAVSGSGDGYLAWHENADGLGNFAPAKLVSYPVNQAVSIAAPDVEGDGDLDVVAAATFGQKITWYENVDGAATFGPERLVSPLPTNTTVTIAAADVDGDGDADLLFASAFENQVAWYEHRNLASPLDPDTDDDGLLDGFEVLYGFDPGVAGEQTGDPDQDGLDNLTEQAVRTSPLDADTDGDGAADGVEVAAGTDPLDPQSFPAPVVPALDPMELGILAMLVAAWGSRRLRRH